MNDKDFVSPPSQHTESSSPSVRTSVADPEKLIESAHILVHGDPSVGIPDTSLSLSGLGWYVTREDREHFREALSDFFGEYFDGRCGVMFNDETDEPEMESL